MIKKIALGLILMAVSTGVAYAAWTIFGQVPNNVFAVGTLTTDVSGAALAVTNGMPGDPPVPQTIAVKNTGNKDVQVKFNTNPTVETKAACDYVKLTVSANWWSGKSYGPTTYTVRQWQTGELLTDVTKPLVKTDTMNVTVSAFLDSSAPQSVELGNCTWDEVFTSE